MRTPFLHIGRILLTLVVVAIAGVAVWRLVSYYLFAPWTRDGHIHADIVQISPDVSGLIQRVEVNDNQPVTKGQVLFAIDQDRFALALRQAWAVEIDQQAVLAQARRENTRDRGLGNLVANEQREESQSRVDQAQTALLGAQVSVDRAQLDLERSVIRSPVDGYINDRAPRVQEYVSAGRPVLSVVDSHSFYTEGYFEETRLDAIHIGQSANIQVMGGSRPLRGHVQSIAAGVEDRDRTPGADLLPDVTPSFSWVRLAQRIPVLITFDAVPEDVRLIVGRTATVSIIPDPPSLPNFEHP